jgi:TPR repeat protein
MTKEALIIAGLVLAVSAPLAHAQEHWGRRGWGEERWERMHYLREACEHGDERACWRLRRMRHEWREHRREEERDWGSRRGQDERDRY